MARSLWWKWTWRDLRHNWAGVAAIAAVIAIGTGVYSGLGSTAAWRRLSNDASFAELRMHDLRVELSPGTFAPEGALVEVALDSSAARSIAATTERLVVDAQIDASTADQTILVSARLIGSTFENADVVDDVWLADGTLPTAGSSPPDVLVEKKFADYYGLPAAGTFELAGGSRLGYTGLGVGPEEFYVAGPQGSVLAEADLANVYLHLADAQRVTGRTGEVNDLVVTLNPDADVGTVQLQLEQAVAELQGVSATVGTSEDTEAYRVLYDDIENDQQIWNALSALVLGAAALAAFNLITRIVEAQRREIGIGMALGVPRRLLAVRPLVIALQVGVIGTIAGIGVGALIGGLMRDLMASLVPMPSWVTPFQTDVFVRGAVLGIVPPVLAAMIPVWRAVRVEPIDAIRTGHYAAASGRLGSWTRRLRVPGTSLTQMPLRNLLRAPRRTVLTALGVGAAITALVAVLAMLDSFDRAIDRGSDEVTRGNPERVTIVLDTFYPDDSPVVAAIDGSSVIASADRSLRVPATVSAPGRDDIDLLLELLDLDAAQWTPSIAEASAGGPTAGVVLADKAARDLGVRVGDTVTVTHPQRVGLGFELVDSDLVVAGTHPNPIRTFAYLDDAFAAEYGLDGFTNALQVTPVEGADRSDVQRAVFTLSGVASAQPVARVGEAFDEAMAQFVGFLAIAAGAVLLLAVLIAFNSARISVDERRRENATMLAFGVGVWRVIGIVAREAVVVGILATVVGVAAGTLVLDWILSSLATRTLPDFEIVRTIDPTTLLVAGGVGVISVAIAPLFLIRRISRMDIPDTLRVME